jgi:cytochrome b561
MLILLIAVYASMELRDFYPKGSAGREAMKTWHYMLGLTVVLLAMLRLAVHLVGPMPAISPRPTKWMGSSAKLMKLALYLLMIILPLAGWLILSAADKPVPFFGLELPHLIGPNPDQAKFIKGWHERIGSWGYWLIGLHAVAGLYHHYIKRDNTLLRMLPYK